MRQLHPDAARAVWLVNALNKGGGIGIYMAHLSAKKHGVYPLFTLARVLRAAQVIKEKAHVNQKC